MLILTGQRAKGWVDYDWRSRTDMAKVRGDKVRLGITAPKCVSVHRKEVYEAIRREKLDKKG